MSSGEEFEATSYDVKLEDVIVKQNSELLALQELLETRSRQLADLRGELHSQSNLVKELDNSLSQQNSIIHILNTDLKAKDLSINIEHNEVIRLTKTLDEVGEERNNLTNQVENLEKEVGEKSLALKDSEVCVARMKHEMEIAQASSAERETEIQMNHEKEMQNLNSESSAQLKLLAEKSLLIEAVLEQQIEVLLCRIKSFSMKGSLVGLDFENCQKEYYKKLNELKFFISKVRDGFLSDTFINEVKGLSSTLPGWLSLEADLEQRLNSQSEKLVKTEEELEKAKQACASAEIKIAELEREIQINLEQKFQLQKHLASANNSYEEITINLNRDRVEMEKKYKQSIDSYELDMDVLNRSLHCLLSRIPKYFNFEEEESYPAPDEPYPILFKTNPDTILNTNVCNAHHLVYKCLCEIEKHCAKVRQISKDRRTLEVSLEIQKHSLEEKTAYLGKVLDKMELMEQKYSSVEQENKFIQNKLKFVQEENISFNTNIELLNSQISDLRIRMKNYQDEISSLTEELRTLREGEEQQEVANKCCKCREEKEYGIEVSKEQFYWSPSQESPMPRYLTTSTPLHQAPALPDPRAAGDHTAHSSTLKWMEKFQGLEKENKFLTSKVNDLEIYNRDLKFTINCVREEMNIFQTKQSNLEDKLGKFISLKKQHEVLTEETKIKDLTIENISKELQHLKNENNELFNKNLELEELYKNNINKLSSSNEGSLTDAAGRLFNEKVKEVICLKKDLCLLEREKESLLLKVDFLLKTNDALDEKLKKLSEQVYSLQENLENAIEEKLQLLSENKLLKKELGLLDLRVQYFSSLPKEATDSRKLLDEMLGDLMGLVDYSVKAHGDHGDGNPAVNVHQFVSPLCEQLSSERALFLLKVQQLQMLINSAQESSGGVSGEWLASVDKLCRSIVEDHKYHAARLQEALSSLAPLPDLKPMGDQIEAMKSMVNMNQMEELIKEKDSVIEVLSGEKETLRVEVSELRARVQDLELKYSKAARAAERERTLAILQNSQKQVQEELSILARTESYSELVQKAREEADAEYQRALKQIKHWFQEDSSSKLLEQQHLHRHQVEKLEEIITAQALQIGLLLVDNEKAVDPGEGDHGISCLKGELSHILCGVRATHQAELELTRLQFIPRKQVTIEGLEAPLKSGKEDTSLLLPQLVTAVQRDFTTRLKVFLHSWHPLYSSSMLEIENTIKSKLEELAETEAASFESLEEVLDSNINQYQENLSLAQSFLEGLKKEYKQIMCKLEEFVGIHVDVTGNCFEKIHLVHSSELLKLRDEASSLKEDIAQLKRMHCFQDRGSHHRSLDQSRSCVSLEREAVKVVRGVVEKVVVAVEATTEREPTACLVTKLTEEHRAELDHLRGYYVQMCSNLEKQYTEDVHSLQSKLASLSPDLAISLDHSYPSIPIVEVEPTKEPSDQYHSSDLVKYIEDLKRNWSDEMNELENRLESKYAKTMKDVHQVLATYMYKNELDICARCLKDEVMRDCEADIAEIKEELSRRALDLEEKARPLSLANRSGGLYPYTSSHSHSSLLPKDGQSEFEHLFNYQKANMSIINELITNMESNVSNIDNKLKDKEHQLLKIQNKINSFSHFVFKYFAKTGEKIGKYNEKTKLFERHGLLVKNIRDGIINGKFSKSELEEFSNLIIAQKHTACDDDGSECATLRLNIHELDKELVNNDNLPQLCFEDYERLVKERDSLKEMTSTLKSAVSQLVMYLNTCEDELNKTVVDELVKICVESPGQDAEHPNPRRVHFAPLVEDPDESQDLSHSLRVQLDSCLAKLKMEAASLLGLTSLHPPPANLNKQIENLQKENEELMQQVAELKLHIDKCQNYQAEMVEEVFSNDLFQRGSSLLIERVQSLISGSDSVSPNSVKILNELAKLGDKIISDLRKEVIDLQQQIIAADKQLKSTRQFLEEQAQERESERDEFHKEVKHLQEQLKESNRHCNSQQLVSLHLQQLELQLAETKAHLEDTEKEKDTTESELKDAIEKIWVLRDIISDLEAELSRKSEKEELLERKLDQLEAELDHHSDTHIAMAQELESLRGQSMEDSYLEQIKQLQENIKIQFDSSVIRSIKVQIHDMELSLERRSKELENLFLNYSNNCLSSPSEEVSVVEQLEVNRTKSPEENFSPVALPVQDLLRLQEKLNRHATVEQVLIKRFRDMQLSYNKLSVQLEEMQAERDVIQKQMKKQMVQLAESNNKIDDLRHKVEMAQTTANRDLVIEVQELKQKYSVSEKAFASLQSELVETRNQLSHAEELIGKHQTDMQKLAESNHRLIQSLRLELASVTKEKNNLENLIIKQKQEIHLDVMSALLADKNEDIDRLQQTVNQLQNQEAGGKHSSCNSKRPKVSFVSDLEDNSTIPEDMRLRDVSQPLSFQFESSKLVAHELSSLSPSSFVKHQVELESPPLASAPSHLNVPSNSSCSTVDDNLDHLLNKLKSESEEKSQQITALEEEVKYLKSVQCDLKSTKSELEAVLSSVSDDKHYYESHLKSLSEEIKDKNEEIKSLKRLINDKDEEVIKRKADVKALEEISLNLQHKLKEATNLAVQEDCKFSEDIKLRKREIENLKEDLTAHMLDLRDEKELSEALKSSLNILTREKTQLEGNVSLFEIENRNLSKALQEADDKLNHYAIVVKNLKNYLLSKQSEKSNKNELVEFDNLEEGELQTLKEEITKMVSMNEQLNSERLKFLGEIEELKTNLLSSNTKESSIGMGQLKEEIIELREAIGHIKEEKLSVFSNFSLEIDQLNKDIMELKESKQQLMGKLRLELLEKKNLHELYSKLLHEVEERDSKQKQGPTKKAELSFCDVSVISIPPEGPKEKGELSFCDVSIMSIPPGDSISGMDALAEKMKNELQLSKSLDNALLKTIEADESNRLSSARSSRPLTVHSLDMFEKALLRETKRCEDAKKSLADKIEKCHYLEVENCQLRMNINRFERLVFSQNEKVIQLSNQVDLQKEKNINLELTVLREQSNFKQVSLLLEHEKTKGRETQKEDIGLIETMRQRLQTLMENEIKLKKLVLEEKTKSDRLLAQFNSIKALENFNMESHNINTGFEEEKRKYLALRIEYEKEKQAREEIQNVLTRERAVISMLQGNLLKSEKTHQEIERELSLKKKNLNEEVVRRQIAEAKIIELQDNFDIRFQKYSKNEEQKKQKELDAAYAIISELEREHSTLMKKHSDVKLDWRETRERSVELGERVRALQKTVSDLERERNFLRERLAERQRERAVECQEWRGDMRAEVVAHVESLFKDLVIAEQQRRALVFQKQYLLVTLRGYRNPRLQLFQPRHQRPSFKSVVLVIIAALKLRYLPCSRLLRFHKKKDKALEKLKSVLFSSEVDRLVISPAPQTRQFFPHSPPSKDLRFY